MKKFFSLILIGILGVMVFTSCDKNTEKKKDEPVKAMTVEDYLAKVDTGDYLAESITVLDDGRTIRDRVVIIEFYQLHSLSKDGEKVYETYIEVKDGKSTYLMKEPGQTKYKKTVMDGEIFKVDSLLHLVTGMEFKVSDYAIKDGYCVAEKEGELSVKVSKEGKVFIKRHQGTNVIDAVYTPGKVAIKYPTADEIE